MELAKGYLEALLRLFLWNWQRFIWKPIEGYGEKGNIFR
ncbi:hypothetical protein CPC197_1433 [Chlamydia psittaci C1/97]|nr:hypothetical protein CPC197_1433 [Chlamydia psittaci C1/97]